MADGTDDPLIRSERRGALALIAFNRPKKRNAFTVEMFRLLGAAVTAADRDPDVRCIVVYGEGPDTTTGLDFAAVAPAWMNGEPPFRLGDVDPWEVAGVTRTKPLVMATRGRTFTLGFELALAADTVIAAADTRFALREVCVGIIPAGGGTFRLISALGWSEAMRYVLTGDEMNAEQARERRLVQAVVPVGTEVEEACAIAERIAKNAPLAVAAALRSSRAAVLDGWRASIASIVPEQRALLDTEDVREAMMAMMERREPKFVGR